MWRTDLGLRIWILRTPSIRWGHTDLGPTDFELRIWDLETRAFVGGPRGGAHGLGANGSRATDLDFAANEQIPNP